MKTKIFILILILSSGILHARTNEFDSVVVKLELQVNGAITNLSSTSISSNLTVGGSIRFTSVSTTFTNYTVGNRDFAILANATNSSITVNLPTATGNIGRRLTIMKISQEPVSVIIQPNGSELINTYSNLFLINLNQSANIISDGTSWWAP